MNILMISAIDMNSSASLGVTKKLAGQYKAFHNLGHQVYHLCLEDGEGILQSTYEKKIIVQQKMYSYFTECSLFLTAPQIAKEYKIDMCYIRYPLADWAFMRMVKGLHNLCKVVVEIPTYPYDHQVKNIKNCVAQFNYLQDKFNRNVIKRYVHLFTTYSSVAELYGIPCVELANAVDAKQIRYIGDKLVYGNDVHLIAVARIQKDHGYDRLISGIKQYYQGANNPDRKIYFHVVGNGEAEQDLKMMVNRLNLGQYVFFHGVKSGKDLEALYLKCQIAVGVLGTFNNCINATSALKHKEYCAFGIPFISCVPDNGIPSELGYYRLLENSESPISIQKLFQFSDEVKMNPDIHSKMRSFAENCLSWDEQLQKVILYGLNQEAANKHHGIQ